MGNPALSFVCCVDKMNIIFVPWLLNNIHHDVAIIYKLKDLFDKN